jgi:hypothetical protein
LVALATRKIDMQKIESAATGGFIAGSNAL